MIWETVEVSGKRYRIEGGGSQGIGMGGGKIGDIVCILTLPRYLYAVDLEA